jgi:hypothetical protein
MASDIWAVVFINQWLDVDGKSIEEKPLWQRFGPEIIIL